MAIARPMPLDAPVTRATLPVRSGPETLGMAAPRRTKRAGHKRPAPQGSSGSGSIVVVVRPAFGEPGFLEQRLAEHVFVLTENRFQGGLGGRGQVVLDLILALGDGQFVTRPQR